MASPEPDELPVVDPNSLGPPCCHLRSKGMYVYNDGLDGGDSHDDYDSSMFWCLKTMKGFGPDDEMVGREDCRNTSRSCYEPT